MTKTVIARVLATSLPAAIIAATTFADASTVAPNSRLILASPVGARGQIRSQLIRRFANPAHTNIVGGGATLPALAYVGGTALTSNPAVPTSGSVFGFAFGTSATNAQYCQTGSGFGRNILTGAYDQPPTYDVNLSCAALGTTPVEHTNGFGATQLGGTALIAPDVDGSDVPMSQTDYQNYLNFRGAAAGGTEGFTEPVSVPSIVGSVAILYNLNGITGRINLNTSEICGIFTGKTTNWGFAGKAFTKTPLKFVYRSDGSGTTFSFSNHLVKVCNNSALSVSQAYTAASGTVSVIGPTPPANSIGESGNVGVANEVAANNGYIGYVEAANAQAVLAPPAINFGLVNGKDPITNLPETAAAFKATALVKDSVLNPVQGTFPAVIALNGQNGVPAPPVPGCVEIAVPQDYANITNGYSIIAVTNLLTNYSGNGSNSTSLIRLIDDLNTPADFGPSAITSVDPASKSPGTGKTGYSALGTSFNTLLKGVASNCIRA